MNSHAPTPVPVPGLVPGGLAHSSRTLPPTPTGRVISWEAPSAEALKNAFPGLQVHALCGVGGMGAVYRAEQIRLGRTVAVKTLASALLAGEEARERFHREALILSGLHHPHVLQVYDFGALPDGTLYIVTEWAEAGDFAKLLGSRAHPLPQVEEWVRQIASALGAVHASGIIHRDLKPGNILVLDDGRLSLADFGLAHSGGGLGAAPLTVNGALFGTFEYMAPEQMESAGKVGPATDLYALGVMTYQMLTGRVPRGAYPKASRLTKVPPQVDAFLNQALATDPAQRPANAAEFIHRFLFACASPVRRRRRQLITLGIALVVFTLTWARLEISRAEREARESQRRESEVSAALRAMRLEQNARALAARAQAAPVGDRPEATVVESADAPASPTHR